MLQCLQTMKGFLADKNESLFGDTSTQLPHILKCYVLNYFLSNNHQTITRKSIQFAHFALLNGSGSPKPLLTTLIFPWMALVWVVDMGHKKRTMPGVRMLALQWYGNFIYVILSKCLTFWALILHWDWMTNHWDPWLPSSTVSDYLSISAKQWPEVGKVGKGLF